MVKRDDNAAIGPYVCVDLISGNSCVVDILFFYQLVVIY